jgi:hypothetical protein
LLEAINSGKTLRFARSVSNVANLANHYSPTLNINVQGGKWLRRSRSASATPSARCSGLTASVTARHKERRWPARTSQWRRGLMAETSWRS